MFQHLDDPIPLAPASKAQIQADIDRGAGLRRRRRSVVVATPLGAAAVTAAAIAFSAWSSGPTQDENIAPAAPPAQSSPTSALSGPPNTAEPAYSACPDPVGDSTGDPDLMLVALDRPAYPFIHFHWDGSQLPPAGTVEALFDVTSADGQRSRQLVVVIVDGTVDSQYVLNPATGERQLLDPDLVGGATPQQGVELSADALGATFPGSAFTPLGGGWVWTASVAVDGTVVDVCDDMVP
jgi:hypothetical protein